MCPSAWTSVHWHTNPGLYRWYVFLSLKLKLCKRKMLFFSFFFHHASDQVSTIIHRFHPHPGTAIGFQRDCMQRGVSQRPQWDWGVVSHSHSGNGSVSCFWPPVASSVGLQCAARSFIFRFRRGIEIFSVRVERESGGGGRARMCVSVCVYVHMCVCVCACVCVCVFKESVWRLNGLVFDILHIKYLIP